MHTLSSANDPAHSRAPIPSGILLFLTIPPAAALWTVGCADRASVAEQQVSERPAPPEAWAVGSEPLLDIGVLNGEEPYQLFGVKSAARLEDGGVVVANAGSGELRFFDAAGRFVRSQGRSGNGPAEWSGPDRVRRLDRGRLVVFDTRLGKRAVVSTDGSFEGSEPAPPDLLFPWDHWVHRGFLVDSPLEPDERGVVARALDRIGTTAGETVRLARVTPGGHIWVAPWANTDLSVDWTIYDLDGRQVANVTTPARFELQDQGKDWVLGVQRDSLDIEHVAVYRLDRAGSAYDEGSLSRAVRATRASLPELAIVDTRSVPDLTSGVKQLATLEEIHYADHYGYTANLDSLRAGVRSGFQLPEGVVFQPLRADADGWAGRIVREGGREGCMISYGRFALLGVPSGKVLCWRTGGPEVPARP